jgi:hypothetical protein
MAKQGNIFPIFRPEKPCQLAPILSRKTRKILRLFRAAKLPQLWTISDPKNRANGHISEPQNRTSRKGDSSQNVYQMCTGNLEFFERTAEVL